MKVKQVLFFVILLMINLAACNKFDSDEGKASASKLSNGKWVVDESPGLTSNDCGDCMADIVLRLKSQDGKDYANICIDTSNPQFADYAKLKNGEIVSFDIARNGPIQKTCGSGAFVILRK
jgi:hypothetical protein